MNVPLHVSSVARVVFVVGELMRAHSRDAVLIIVTLPIARQSIDARHYMAWLEVRVVGSVVFFREVGLLISLSLSLSSYSPSLMPCHR